jgi:hypothetical protein
MLLATWLCRLNIHCLSPFASTAYRFVLRATNGFYDEMFACSTIVSILLIANNTAVVLNVQFINL